MVTAKEKSDKLILNIKDFSKGFDITCGENITSMDTAIVCYNFDFNSGVLKEGLGFKNFTTPISSDSDENQIEIMYDDFEYDIKSVWHYRNFSVVNDRYLDKILFYASDGYVWYLVLNCSHPSTTRITKFNFTKKPKMFARRMIGFDCAFLSNDTDSLAYWNGDASFVRYPDFPKMISLCEYKSRLFYVVGGEERYIKYSKNYHITQWTETLNPSFGEGQLEITDGQDKINRLISFQGYLYAIRDYSIVKITWYEDSLKPTSMTSVYVSSSKIYADTLEICGDKMYVLTRGGIVKFDGVTARLVDNKLGKLLQKVDNKNASACFHNGVYALACKLNYKDDQKIGCETQTNFVNNTLLMLDTETNEYTLTRGIDVADLVSLECESLNKILLCFNTEHAGVFGEITEEGKFFANNSHKYWCSPLSDLGYSNKKKIVKEVSLLSKYNCTLTIFTEKESKSFKVYGSEILNKYPVRLSGKQVGFKIETDEAHSYISNLMLDIELADTGNAI